MRQLLSILAAVLLPSSALAHGKSKSFAEWTFRSHTAELRINFAGHDVAVAIPEMDVNGDGLLSPVELNAKRDVLGRETIAQTVLAASEEGPPLPCRGHDPEVRGIGAPVVSELEVRAVWTCSSRIARVHVESRQLPELEPPHVTVATFLAGKTTAQHVFNVVSPEFDLDVELPSLAQELGASALAGVRSSLAPAALLFLLGLLVFERPKQVFLLFGAYLLAFHAAGLLHPLSPPPAWYPLVFALAVAWIGLELIARRAGPMPRRKPILGALLAAGFGAVMAPKVDLPNRLAFALGETAVAVALCAAAVALAVVLRERSTQYRRPVGIAWICGAGALFALALL